MWTTTLPTGTVRDEGRGSRTFPKQSTSAASEPGQQSRSPSHIQRSQPQQWSQPQQRSQPHQRSQPQQGSHQDHGGESTVIHQSELDRLREENRQANAEIERLESQVDQLQTQLADHKQAEQAIIDRYEHIIAELESAAATAPTSTRDSTAANTNRTAKSGLLGRLKRWL